MIDLDVAASFLATFVDALGRFMAAWRFANADLFIEKDEA